MQIATVPAPTSTPPAPVPPPGAFVVPAVDRRVLGAVASRAAQAGARVTPGDVPALVRAVLDAGLVLPPGTVGQARELARLHAIERSRASANDAWAHFYDEQDIPGVWHAFLAEYQRTASPADAARAAALLDRVIATSNAVTNAVKADHPRPRPFTTDPTLTTVIDHSHASTMSYPSAHATTAYAAAGVLAALMPERAGEIRRAAANVAWSRMYDGVHYPSDVRAGAYIGAFVAAALLHGA